MSMIQLSDSAKIAVQKLVTEQKRPNAFLRIGVKGGGCSGMTYDVKLDEHEDNLDRVFDLNGVKVVCDSKSFIYLDGMTIDFSNELVGGGFRFVNPNASGTCGCGTSFAV
jgi:iron-sulfur cluster assembly protein